VTASSHYDLTVVVRVATPRLLLRFRSSDPDSFDQFKALYRARFGPVTRWSRADGAWVLPVRERAPLAAWLSLYVAADDIAWVHDVGGWGRASYSSATDPASQAYATLCLTPEAPLPLVELVYRWHMKTGGHPDAGGHHAQAVALNQAVALIRAAS